MGRDPVVLPMWYDVDDVAALHRLHRELFGQGDKHDCTGAHRARHSAAFMRDLFRKGTLG
jgi:hypothetical protein